MRSARSPKPRTLSNTSSEPPSRKDFPPPGGNGSGSATEKKINDLISTTQPLFHLNLQRNVFVKTASDWLTSSQQVNTIILLAKGAFKPNSVLRYIYYLFILNKTLDPTDPQTSAMKRIGTSSTLCWMNDTIGCHSVKFTVVSTNTANSSH